MSSKRRALIVLLTFVGAALAVVAAALPASAHASLVGTSPTEGSVVAERPSSVRLTFDEPVEATDGAVGIVGPDGQGLAGLRPRVDPDDGQTIVVDLPDSLPDGTYDVTWRILSIDGHPVQGVFDFAVGDPSSPLVGGSSSAGGGGPTPLGGAGRALTAAGALSVVGLAAFPPLVLVPSRRRLKRRGTQLVDETCRRLHAPLLVAAAATVVGTGAVLVDTASGSGSLVQVATGTRTGLLLLARIVAVIVTTVVLTVGTGGRLPTGPRLSVGLAGSVATLLTFSLSSHAAAAVVDRPLALAFDIAHLSAAGVWTGGLLALALAGLPAARSVAGKDLDLVGQSAAALFSGYSVVAQVAMVVVLVTGAYAALIQISSLSDLGQTGWGVALTAKLALWISVLLFAAVNAFIFVPALAGRAAARARRLAAVDQLRSAVRVELGLAAALIVIAALMSATAQPTQLREVAAREAALKTKSSTTAKGVSHGYVATVKVARQGVEPAVTTVFRVALTTEDTLASAPTAEAVLTGSDGVGRGLQLELSSEGVWTSPGVDVPPGRYLLTTQFDRRDRPVIIPVNLTLPS